MYGRGLEEETRAVQPAMKIPLVSLDGLALVAVFLQATELYRPLGFLAGFPNSRAVNIVFLLFFLFYLVARNKTLAQLRSGVLAGWVCALFVAPALIMSLQLLDNSVTTDRMVYWNTLSLLFTLLFLVVVVLWTRWGPSLSMPFFLACIGAAWVGFAVNWLKPDFIDEVTAFGSILGSWTKKSQVLGFYPSYNVAALSLVFFFVSLACDRKFLTSNLFLQMFVAMSSISGVLITGSRTSLILVTIAFAWYIKNLRGEYRGGSSGSRTRALTLLLTLLTVIVMGLVLLQLIVSSRTNIATMITSRAGSVVELLGGSEDASLETRLATPALYFADLMRSPLLGQGLDFASNEIALGNYANVSQIFWLERALALGIPYALLMALMLWFTYRLAARLGRSYPFLLSYARLMLLIIVITTFSITNPFSVRSPACAFGVFLGVLLYVGETRPRSDAPSRTGLLMR